MNKNDLKLEADIDMSDFDREFRKAKLAMEELGFAIGDSLWPIFKDMSAEFAKIGVAYLESFIEGIIVYRWPLWFTYLVLSMALVLITLVLGV